MRTDTKTFIEMDPKLREDILALGYRTLKVEDENLFSEYYAKLEDYYGSSLCFANLIGWEDTFPTFFTEYEGYIVGLNYDYIDGIVYALPFLGKYTEEGIKKAFLKVQADMKSLGRPFIIYDVADWMLPYYKATGAEFEITSKREEMDYMFTREMFKAGMDKQDDRYRYNYFKRKFNYETVEITPDIREEIFELMEDVWCGHTEDCEDCAYGCLKHIVDKLVMVFDKLDIHGIMVRVDGVPEGFCMITEFNGMGVYQYKNANNRIKGINEYLLRECFERYMGDAEVINYTEDLGLVNLRMYKENMAPEYFLMAKNLLKVM